MARVTLDLGGTKWTVNTRDGGEPEVRRLGAMLAERWPQALRAAGDGGVPQALLLTALMLADELAEAREAAGDGAAIRADFDKIAVYLESLAEALERGPPND
jgi:cell division protein ZapA